MRGTIAKLKTRNCDRRKTKEGQGVKVAVRRRKKRTGKKFLTMDTGHRDKRG